MYTKYIVFLLWVCLCNVSYAQQLRPRVTPDRAILSLNDKTGYRCNFSYFDAKTNRYARSASTRSYGSFLEFYDLTSGEMVEVQHFPKIGELTQFVQIGDNTFWGFDAASRWLYLLEHGEVKDRVHEVKSEDYVGSYTSYYVDQAFNPMAYHGGKLYVVPGLMSVRSNEEDFAKMSGSPFIRLYDIQGKILSWVGEFPKASVKDDYGYLNRFSSVQMGKRLLIAPFYSNELFVFDLKNGSMTYPIVPKDNAYYAISSPFAPLTATPKSLKPEAGAHFDQNSYYLGILHDPHRRLYYRVKVNPNDANNGEVDREIVVLDETYRVKGVFAIPSETYKTDGMFVTKEGLYILNYGKYKKDNTKLVFDCFTL